ncbi:HpcH/HpaI aldolase family protein [Arthrobacter sp. Soil762]|uniref:HpcH/HpaI aldolase family protein n=1 Tax=Arthrobacter sp. Soil762 TaxID=1736401 RepID=UPI0006F1E04E|nr:aldolase/citrate lyase family protein [Arthrobacter sp. Soil762]KRE71147.1 siderophore biosynthesis protein SbnG [Arthrobacter sp. Soil762]
MPRPRTLARLFAGPGAVGLYCSLTAPSAVEMIGHAGFDFVILDTEHALVGDSELAALLRAAEAAGLDALVRVPEGDHGAILRALDAGAAGVVVPHVRCRADVDAAIRAARYFPDGMRSLGGGRAADYGVGDPREVLRRANAEVVVAVLIEDREGVEAIDEILTGGGVDVVLPGPGDLSQSYGVPWETRHPLVRAAVETIHEACRRHAVPFAPMTTNPEAHARWSAAGATSFILGDAQDLAARSIRDQRALAEQPK